MGTVFLSGSQGFIGSYICEELLARGYRVVGVDNFSKYGKVTRAHDAHENFRLITADMSKLESAELESENIDYIIAGAAMIGGISLFSEYPYTLLAKNEAIIGNTFDVALDLYRVKSLKRIVVISSSMVFESVETWPTKESDLLTCPPPISTYGFQKLSTEYFAKGAFLEFGLPYTIVRPFNAVGLGEGEAAYGNKMQLGNSKMMMSHVLPDIILRALFAKPNEPLTILGDGNQIRCYTNGLDIANGIVTAMESPKALNEDFNISNPKAHSVKELATIVWNQIHGCDPTFAHADPFEWDVQKRIPDVTKAREILGFEAKIPLEQSVAEVIEWMRGGDHGQAEN